MAIRMETRLLYDQLNITKCRRTVHTYNDELSCTRYALRYVLSPLCGAEIWSRGKMDQKYLGRFET